MRQRTVASTLVAQRGRLDANYYLAPGVAARDRVHQAYEAGVPTESLGEIAGPRGVWQPSRFKRTYVASSGPCIAYLRPYDAFEYLPEPAAWLSTVRTDGLDNYRIQQGTLLQTCSGRNLGPLTSVDDYLSRWVLSHDMIRININERILRNYIYAFLSAPTGQAMLRHRMSGSVIDHLTTEDVGSLEIPLFNEGIRRKIADIAASSLSLLAKARQQLDEVRTSYQCLYPPSGRQSPRKHGWTVPVTSLEQRLDAHFHDPLVAAAKAQLKRADGIRCGDVAQAILPLRYKRYYVDPEYGRPILSGRQLLQIDPINLRYISDRSFKDSESMVLRSGMVAFGAVGRWEGRLGQPALVTSDRDGWLASNDVMRLRPRQGCHPGWLWLGMACQQVRTQIAALPYGSVIDHTGPEDVEDVILPPIDETLANDALEAWERFVQARTARQQAVDLLEAELDAYALGRRAGSKPSGHLPIR